MILLLKLFNIHNLYLNNKKFFTTKTFNNLLLII